MSKIEIPIFKTIKERNKFLVEHKDILAYQRKQEVKPADGIGVVNMMMGVDKAHASKADTISLDTPSLTVSAVINTTNVIDSHCDLHIPGLWKKSLQENKMIMHLQEHRMAFDHIISSASQNTLKAYTETMSWYDLGYDFEGQTEALIFDSVIKEANKKPRNPYMFEQYAKGYVENHSVGMRYVKIVMCINDDNYGAEYEAWEKYIQYAVNKDYAEELGYFWAVTEAKVIEGSAVPIGSNRYTPTRNTKGAGITTPKNIEPSKDTQRELLLQILNANN